MIKCNLCGKEFDGGRQAHSHMNRMHHSEYEAVDFNLEEVTEGYVRIKPKVFKPKGPGEKIEKKEEPKKIETSDRPKRLRLLSKVVPEELEAYRAGYRYYDPESELAFTTEECQEEGWI